MTTVFLPILFASPILKVVPLKLQNFVLENFVKFLQKKHSTVFDALQKNTSMSFAFYIAELPYPIYMKVQPNNTSVCFTSDCNPDTKISGNLYNIFLLLQGSVDGDSLFFSRQISVQGNTEFLLILRNVFDGENINLKKDILDYKGIGSTLLHKIFFDLHKVYKALEKESDRIEDGLLKQLRITQGGLEYRLEQMSQQLTHTNQSVLKQTKKLKQLDKKLQKKALMESEI